MLRLLGMKFVASALCIIVLGAHPSRAESKSTDLIDNCRSQMNDFCLGYLSGFAQAANLEEKRVYYCFPEDASAKQLVAVYLKWADENPNMWQLPWRYTVGRAFHVAFPCENK